MELRTPRLLLRDWEPRDAAPFAALNADPEVTRHFPFRLTRERSDILIGRFRERVERTGYSFLATERLADGAFLGMVGVSRVDLPGTPVDGVVETGWRLARMAWGHGYATEGAAAAITWAFETLDIPEIVAFTASTNRRSEAVMKRLGMRRDAARDFDHPVVPEGSPLRSHITYAVSRAEWMERAAP